MGGGGVLYWKKHSSNVWQRSITENFWFPQQKIYLKKDKSLISNSCSQHLLFIPVINTSFSISDRNGYLFYLIEKCFLEHPQNLVAAFDLQRVFTAYPSVVSQLFFFSCGFFLYSKCRFRKHWTSHIFCWILVQPLIVGTPWLIRGRGTQRLWGVYRCQRIASHHGLPVPNSHGGKWKLGGLTNWDFSAAGVVMFLCQFCLLSEPPSPCSDQAQPGSPAEVARRFLPHVPPPAWLCDRPGSLPVRRSGILQAKRCPALPLPCNSPWLPLAPSLPRAGGTQTSPHVAEENRGDQTATSTV